DALPSWRPVLRELRRNHIGVWASALASSRSPFATLRTVMAALDSERVIETLADFCLASDEVPMRSHDAVPDHLLPLVSTLQAIARADPIVLVVEAFEGMDAESRAVFSLFEHVLFSDPIAVIICAHQEWFDAMETQAIAHVPRAYSPDGYPD
ncbi:MAG: hypothetical protein ACYDGM_00620, partial [Vulcanimicrobiaceae bacterium]